MIWNMGPRFAVAAGAFISFSLPPAYAAQHRICRVGTVPDLKGSTASAVSLIGPYLPGLGQHQSRVKDARLLLTRVPAPEGSIPVGTALILREYILLAQRLDQYSGETLRSKLDQVGDPHPRQPPPIPSPSGPPYKAPEFDIGASQKYKGGTKFQVGDPHNGQPEPFKR